MGGAHAPKGSVDVPNMGGAHAPKGSVESVLDEPTSPECARLSGRRLTSFAPLDPNRLVLSMAWGTASPARLVPKLRGGTAVTGRALSSTACHGSEQSSVAAEEPNDCELSVPTLQWLCHLREVYESLEEATDMPWRDSEVNSSPARRHNDPDVPPKVSCNSSPCNEERRTLSVLRDRRSPRLSTSSRSRADAAALLSARSVNARVGSILRPRR